MNHIFELVAAAETLWQSNKELGFTEFRRKGRSRQIVSRMTKELDDVEALISKCRQEIQTLSDLYEKSPG